METQTQTTAKTSIQEKREVLKQFSKAVAPAVKSGQFDNINEALINTIYKDETHQTFKTYEQWKAEGKQVQKGEKAFLVWGKPKGTREDEAPQDEDKSQFFPLCFLFSNAQVK